MERTADQRRINTGAQTDDGQEQRGSFYRFVLVSE